MTENDRGEEQKFLDNILITHTTKEDDPLVRETLAYAAGMAAGKGINLNGMTRLHAHDQVLLVYWDGIEQMATNRDFIERAWFDYAKGEDVLHGVRYRAKT
jgi:hypothetical protein